MNDNRRKTMQLTPEQRAKHKTIRDAFRDWRPGPEELHASHLPPISHHGRPHGPDARVQKIMANVIERFRK